MSSTERISTKSTVLLWKIGLWRGHHPLDSSSQTVPMPCYCTEGHIVQYTINQKGPEYDLNSLKLLVDS